MLAECSHRSHFDQSKEGVSCDRIDIIVARRVENMDHMEDGRQCIAVIRERDTQRYRVTASGRYIANAREQHGKLVRYSVSVYFFFFPLTPCVPLNRAAVPFKTNLRVQHGARRHGRETREGATGDQVSE